MCSNNFKALKEEDTERIIQEDRSTILDCVNCGYKDIAERFFLQRVVECPKCRSKAIVLCLPFSCPIEEE